MLGQKLISEPAHGALLLYNTNAQPSLSSTETWDHVHHQRQGTSDSPAGPGQIRSKERWDHQLPSGVEGSSAPTRVAETPRALLELLLQGFQGTFKRFVRPLLSPLVMTKKKKRPKTKTQLQRDKTEK